VGTGRHLADWYEARANALDRAGNPPDGPGYPGARQQELLRQIRRVITDAAAAGRRAAGQETQLRRSAGRLHRQARSAVAAGRDDLAWHALAVRGAILARADELSVAQAALRADQARLSAAVRRLQPKVEALRLHQELLRARATAAQAASAAGPLLSGISAEMGDVDLATRRAEDTTARLRGRSDALAEQLAAAPPAGQPGLDTTGPARARVEEELAAIRNELAAVPRPFPGRAE
jgi:phage shock protein A